MDPTAGRRDLYDYDQAAALTFYAPESIRVFCGSGRLERGVHFIVARWYRGRYLRRCRLITAAGVAFLLDRRANGKAWRHARVTGNQTSQATRELHQLR